MDKKLPDAKIVKGLEEWFAKICMSYQTSLDLGYVGIATETEDYICLMRGTIDLINRLQAENERLKIENKLLIDNDISNKFANCVLVENGRIYTKTLEDYDNLIGDISKEGMKEFAERSEKEIFIKQEDERKQMLKILKTYRGTKAYSDTEQATDNWLRGYGEAVQDVLGVFNNLLKELVGDN